MNSVKLSHKMCLNSFEKINNNYYRFINFSYKYESSAPFLYVYAALKYIMQHQTVPVELWNIFLLGSSLGDAAKNNSLTEKFEALQCVSCRLRHIKPHQTLFLLKNAMYLPKINYLRRTLSLDGHEILKKYDEVQRKSFEQMWDIKMNDKKWN